MVQDLKSRQTIGVELLECDNISQDYLKAETTKLQTTCLNLLEFSSSFENTLKKRLFVLKHLYRMLSQSKGKRRASV